MTRHRRRLEGNAGMPTGSSGDGGSGREPEMIPATSESAGYTRLPKPRKHWISHRMGPFMVHSTEDCDPKAKGCFNSYDNLIGQGFMPCPK